MSFICDCLQFQLQAHGWPPIICSFHQYNWPEYSITNSFGLAALCVEAAFPREFPVSKNFLWNSRQFRNYHLSSWKPLENFGESPWFFKLTNSPGTINLPHSWCVHYFLLYALWMSNNVCFAIQIHFSNKLKLIQLIINVSFLISISTFNDYNFSRA